MAVTAQNDNKGLRRGLRLGLFAACLLSSVVLPAVSGARAQQDVAARLGRLENEIQTLSRAVFRGEQPPPSAALPAAAPQDVSGLESRIAQIEADVRTLTGQMEQEGFEARRRQETLEKAFTDLERRLAELEMQMGAPAAFDASASNGGGMIGRGSAAAQTGTDAPSAYRGVNESMAGVYEGEESYTAAGTQAAPATDVPPVPAPPSSALPAGQLGTLTQNAETGAVVPPVPEGGGPADYYERAFSLLRLKNYAEAEKAFNDFLDRYPDDNLASNAKYWLGETYYVRADYERAARIFAEVYQKFPKSPKGPDSLLKLGMSLAGMGKKNDACLTFSQLRREYAAGTSPVLSRAAGETERLGCPE